MFFALSAAPHIAAGAAGGGGGGGGVAVPVLPDDEEDRLELDLSVIEEEEGRRGIVGLGFSASDPADRPVDAKSEILGETRPKSALPSLSASKSTRVITLSFMTLFPGGCHMEMPELVL